MHTGGRLQLLTMQATFRLLPGKETNEQMSVAPLKVIQTYHISRVLVNRTP